MAEKAGRDHTCGNCIFWDLDIPDPDEILFRPYDKNKKFVCRQTPAVFYKSADEWCGQHRAKVK